MKKINKISLGILSAATLVGVVSTTMVSCGTEKTSILAKGDNNKQTGSWKPNKDIVASPYTPKQPTGDKTTIKIIEDWMNSKNINGFNTPKAFVKNTARPFYRSPQTITKGSKGFHANMDDLNNLPSEEFGMNYLEDFIKSKNGTLKISLIEKTKHDPSGTLIVKATININGKSAVFQFKISGFSKTKDFRLKGEDFKTINQIIQKLDSLTNLGFEKNISIMTPQDLKQELIDLYHDTNGGRLTIIGEYQGTKSVVSLDENEMLIRLINSFGDVSKTKRFKGTFAEFTVKIAGSGGKLDGGFGKVLNDYHSILSTERINSLIGLFGNIDRKVFNLFPKLIKIFDNVANGVKEMDMVKNWAKNNVEPGTGKTFDTPKYRKELKKSQSELDRLNFSLIEFVLNSGSKK